MSIDFHAKQKNNKQKRLFFALWPNDEVREQIRQASKKILPGTFGGRQIKASNFHITLHFIGNIDKDLLSCLVQQAGKVHTDAFTIYLDKSGYFKKPRIFWFGCHEIPVQLTELHQKLGRLLASCGYEMEQRTYQPHVSLVRKITRPELLNDIEPIKWQANDFVLVESLSTPDGVDYQVLETFSLMR